MSATPHHIVRKQILELELDRHPDVSGQAQLDRLANFGEDRLAVIVDKVLTKNFPSVENFYIDQLKIEVDVENLDQLEEVLVAQFTSTLQNAEVRREQVAKTMPTRLNPLLVYLRDGSLPWTALATTSLAELWAEFGFRLQSSKAGKSSKAQTRSSKKKADNQRVILMRRQLFAWLQGYPQSIRRFLRDLGAKTLLNFLIEQSPTHLNWEWTEEVKSVFLERILAWQRSRKREFFTEIGAVGKNDLCDICDKTYLSHKSAKIAEKNRKSTDSPSTTAPQFLENAGLALLHTFLIQFLAERGVVKSTKEGEGNKPRLTVTDYPKAGALLYGLCGGESPQQEWDLSMAKLMLGYPSERVMDVVTLTEDDLSAIDQLLEKVISQWTKLGKTQPAGLRTAFLQRPGKISDSEYGKTITLEQRPYDMLLDELPWQINFIRLPWMNTYLNLDTGR